MHWSRMASSSTARPSSHGLMQIIPMVILCIINLKSSDAYQNFTVGDSQGWGVANASFYQNWAAGKNFTLGDYLLFNYPNMDENVVVTRNASTYESCDVYGSSVDSVWGQAGNSTYSEVPLIETGETYFMSGTESGEHCHAGVRFAINVTRGEGLPPGFVLPPPPSPDEDVYPPSDSGGGGGSSFPTIDDIPPPPPPPSSAPFALPTCLLSTSLLLCVPFLLPVLL